MNQVIIDKPNRVLFVDDESYRYDCLIANGSIHDETVHAPNAKNAISLLVDREWDVVFLDHDLETFEHTPYPREITGYDVARTMLDLPYRPKMVIVHSMNFVAARRMMNLLLDHGFNAMRIPFGDLSPYVPMRTDDSPPEDEDARDARIADSLKNQQ